MTKLSTLIVAASALALLSTSNANAVSLSVKLACAKDYYAYCSKHPSGSQSARKCMRANGSKLSKRCVNALISAGLVSKSYVAKRRAAKRFAVK